MIKVTVIYVGNEIRGLKVTGHANSQKYGQDLICASVSSIVTGGFNAFDEDDIVSIKLEEGFGEVFLKRENDVIKTIIIQLKTIAEEFPQYLEINSKKEVEK